ncbi:SpoIIAA family protein [Flavobacterium aquicola]|uniref:SpoIIAA-like protein n=1 Tax=Flavobacterium aquicola TaxID=1682742 RepID=A0A3E0EEB3_9FLAO|nr:STAS/SEC14 domain-containing protein [Flavobacterium aquicola]REG96093.1 SpoIIAA-like protein [Flavobacterium aquicola]
MIQLESNTPSNVAAFRATGEVTKEDYENVVIPEVERVISSIGHINFLLYLDTAIENFTAGAWVQDALLGLKNIAKWNRAAIVTDSDTAITFTNGFSYFVPGEFKGFKKEQYNEAVTWVSEETL